jgi:exosortase/archaeosortase family protein
MPVRLRVWRPTGPALAAARELPLRAAALIGLVLLAYNYSLLTLARGLTLQTPLAYLALVPIIAIGLAVARLRIEPRGVPIHDRQVDWIVGVLLLGGTAAILIVIPNSTSSGFWLQRVDLLTLPLFVSGLIALLFGVRRVWSLRFPIAFLLLAWPVPYSLFLSGAAGQFTDITAGLVRAVTWILPVAQVSASDNTLFFVGQGADRFGVSIGSACAGLNGFVGFLILGTALLYVVRGPILRRAIWMVVGLAIVFGLNAVRILGILGMGAMFGQAAALDVLHPVAGMLVFTAGVVGMVALVPRFGLRIIGRSDVAAAGPETDTTPVRRLRPALLVAVGLTAILAVTNATYSRYEAISSGLGDARLQSFDASQATVPKWDGRFISSFPMAKQYFGSSATWDRALWWPTEHASLYSSRSVYVDVLTTGDPGTLVAYSLEACYRFHGYQVASIATADIGAGVQAQVIDYVNAKVDAKWSALWWEWPYDDNGQTRYERIVILMSEGPTGEFDGVTAAPIGTQAPDFAETDQFLVSLAQEIVGSQLNGIARP